MDRDGGIHGKMDGWMGMGGDVWMDGLKDGWMDGWMEMDGGMHG